MTSCSDTRKVKTEDGPWGTSSFMGQVEEEMPKKVTENNQESRKRIRNIWYSRSQGS